MKNNQTPCCVTAPKLIFPCSGVSDVGEISDRAARKLTRNGIGRMYCLAGIGGRVENIIESTKAASKILSLTDAPQIVPETHFCRRDSKNSSIFG